MKARGAPVIAPFVAPTSTIVSPVLRNSRKDSASRVKASKKTERLNVTKSRSAGQECWTIKTGKRGEKQADFRVRLADSGFRVVLSFYDDSNVRRERYCCYLSADEWRESKRKSLTDFARLIADKVDARHVAGDLDAARYQEIAPRLSVIA